MRFLFVLIFESLFRILPTLRGWTNRLLTISDTIHGSRFYANAILKIIVNRKTETTMIEQKNIKYMG